MDRPVKGPGSQRKPGSISDSRVQDHQPVVVSGNQTQSQINPVSALACKEMANGPGVFGFSYIVNAADA